MYYHTDHLNTPKLFTNQNQEIVWQAEHTPFGELSIAQEQVQNNIRFPGQYFDVETGMSYNYFRTYDPSLGRYLQSDPIGLGGGINTYGYVGGNPVNIVDPDGLFGRALPRYVPIAPPSSSGMSGVGGYSSFPGSSQPSGRRDRNGIPFEYNPYTDQYESCPEDVEDDEEVNCWDIYYECTPNIVFGDGHTQQDRDEMVRQCIREKAPQCISELGL